ncbi:MAG TPA: hypothetical protein VJN18_05710 [Polyangiaceae bacterium]|nr:hypothetical protein [Polyangiaceae bacterium]
MRSWPERWRLARARSALGLALLLPAAALPLACDKQATEQAESEKSALDCEVTYENFAGPFLLNWCIGCHSSSLGMAERQKAPLGTDFDTLEGVRAKKDLVRKRVVEDQTMPLLGGPSADERELFGKWLDCDLPAEGEGFTPASPGNVASLPPVPSGDCAKAREPLPEALLPRCQASTLDCIVQCGIDNPDYGADACRDACQAADTTPPDTSLGTAVSCATCTLAQLLACTDSSGCHDETARFMCCFEACGGAANCAETCNGELQAFVLCSYYKAPQCVDYVHGPMSACFAPAAPEPDPSGAGGAGGAGNAL